MNANAASLPDPAPTSARQGVAARKRAAILEAALGEFETRGFRETSMDRIAESAGVSKRTVYNHFASKEALFDEIVGQLSERVALGTDFPYDPDRPLEQQLRQIGGQVLDMLVAPCFGTLARVALMEMIRSPALAQRTYDMVRRRQSGLAQWLADAHADGRLAVPDPAWAADQFLGLIKSFALWPQILGGQPLPGPAERARIVESSVDMLLRSYLPR